MSVPEIALQFDDVVEMQDSLLPPSYQPRSPYWKFLAKSSMDLTTTSYRPGSSFCPSLVTPSPAKKTTKHSAGTTIQLAVYIFYQPDLPTGNF